MELWNCQETTHHYGLVLLYGKPPLVWYFVTGCITAQTVKEEHINLIE